MNTFAITEATVITPYGELGYWLHQPTARKGATPPALLLTVCSTRQASFYEEPYAIPARRFAAAGHAVVSVDLPNHGEQVNAFGEGIRGMCAAVCAGADPFGQFVTQGQAVIAACLAQGVGGGGVFACGVSRAGYCALRLAAADPCIRGVAGLAPVTDWRVLDEFAAVRHHSAVAALALEHYADPLAGRAVFLAIGNHDRRVSSAACLRFGLRLLELEAATNTAASTIELHLVAAAGHALGAEWRTAGADFLLRHIAR